MRCLEFITFFAKLKHILFAVHYFNVVLTYKIIMKSTKFEKRKKYTIYLGLKIYRNNHSMSGEELIFKITLVMITNLKFYFVNGIANT